MMSDDDLLCCCEYINENGERSHLLLALCNCETLDEIFERLVSRQQIRSGLYGELMDTVWDRIRIPWPGGAKKLSIDLLMPLSLNFALILLGSLNFAFTVITYLLLLPIGLYLCHRFIKRRNRTLNKRQFDFYTCWLISGIVYLITLYYACVVFSLKISSTENLIFVVLLILSLACFYIVVKKGHINCNSKKRNHGHSSSLNCDTCADGQLDSKKFCHCKICGACYMFRDHHCLWLNVCVGYVNDRWFLAALLFAFSCLLQGVYLTFTTVCHPRITQFASFEILYPYSCLNAYVDRSSSLMFSGGCYALVLLACVVALLIYQCYSISCGYRRLCKLSDLPSRSTLRNVFENWYIFLKH